MREVGEAVEAKRVEDAEDGCEDDQGQNDCARGGWVVDCRDRAGEKGEGVGGQKRLSAVQQSRLVGRSPRAHSSSSLAIMSSWDIIDDILDNSTHETNPASYLITDQDHRSTLQSLRPHQGAEYTIEQAICGSLLTTGLARKQPLPQHILIPPTVSIDVRPR